MSTSYPYLTLSRRLGVRYGDVLRVVDYLDTKCHVVPDDAYGRFCRLFDFRDIDVIYDAWESEQERRRCVLSES